MPEATLKLYKVMPYCYNIAMFIRTKSSPRSNSISIQLVESYRDDGKIKQRVVSHIGTAKSEEDLLSLKKLASVKKAELENKQQMTNDYGLLGQLRSCIPTEKINANKLEELQRKTIGIHDVYGKLYNQLGLSNLFSRPKQKARLAKLLKNIVLCRIASPSSKRSSVFWLNKHAGLKLKLDHVYQMMDKIDKTFRERLQKKALAAALQVHQGPLQVLFYDVTTLYFESFSEDSLKQNGYSKDMKFNQPQVLFSLIATNKGIPVGYEIFPGATFEGHTLIPILERLKSNYEANDLIVVADRGMLNKDNLAYLDQHNVKYIVGARLKNLSKNSQNEVLSWGKTVQGEKSATHTIKHAKSKLLFLSYRFARAKKDKADREKAITKLKNKLKKSSNPKTMISNYGYQKYLKLEGDSKVTINKERLDSEKVWDGITGVMTNLTNMSAGEALKQYNSLWKIEYCFRINKSDMRIRPIYHWTPSRIQAHLAISFMAFMCVRHLEYRVGLIHKKLSPETIKENLLSVQVSEIIDTKTNKTYILPSKVSYDCKQIYKTMGLSTLQKIMVKSA